jgi:hypothetical protein
MKIPSDKRFIDLRGKKFNRLTVIDYTGKKNNQHCWLCRCDCGKEKIILGGCLKKGTTKSCGCLQREITAKQMIDLKDKRFGRLLVLQYEGVGKIYNKHMKQHLWLCKCDCGNDAIVSGNSLRAGNTQSCGCYHTEKLHTLRVDLAGRKFGKLSVIKFSHMKNKQSYWLCKCDCGVEKLIAGNSLNHGKSKSCGCRKGRFTHGLSGKPGYKQYLLSDPVRKLRHYISARIRLALKGKKNYCSVFDYLPYTIKQYKEHIEGLWEPWMNWDNHGKKWHIDHIVAHSKFPYTSMSDPLFQKCWELKNLRPLEKIANLKKGSK